MDRTGTSTTISGTMELSGPEATGVRAGQIETSINTAWTNSFKDGYSVKCKIVVRLRPPGTAATPVTQIDAVNGIAPSRFNPLTRVLTLNANEADAFTWAAAHEFGHVIGLKDRYSESIGSRLRGMVGGTRTGGPDRGYKGNLMGETGGTLSSQNIIDLAEETAPSAYWMNDDDHIRDWVNAHTRADIQALSAADKLRAIWILQGGWISDDDVNVMGKICDAVTNKTEADAIRAGVNVLIFTSLGQRTTMRVFLSKMPR